MQDDELLSKFEDTSLPLSVLRHEKHVRIAFLYLQRYPLLEVLARFPVALQRYAAAHGKNGLYHQTISWAFLFIVHERMAAAGTAAQTWDEFKARNGDLLQGSKSTLAKYYRDETIASPAAREHFVMPDRWMPDDPR
jgi:hypothetical protein